MIQIDKGYSPSFWKEFVKAHPNLEYKNLDNTAEGVEFRKKIRDYDTGIQHGLCCYCCKRINETNANNEHIKPQSLYPKESLAYHNILSSCNTSYTCTNKKGNQYDGSLFISPLNPECEEEFDYAPNGTISARSSKGQYTINLLNLNSRELCRARAAMYRICCSYTNSNMLQEAMLVPDPSGMLHSYFDALKYYCKHVF